MSYAYARSEGSELHLATHGQVVNPALFELQPEGVRLTKLPLPLRVWFESRVRDSSAESANYKDGRYVVAQHIQIELKKYLQRASLPVELRRRLKGIVKTIDDYASARETTQVHLSRPYYRRALIREPIAVSLSRQVEARARTLASTVRLDLDAPIVTLHAREAGWKKGREIHERKLGARDDSARNSRIESYFDAIDLLISRGYTVVRVGDPSMVPLARRGVVDLATSPVRDQVLQLAALMRSRFLICGEAGPAAVTYLTNTPALTVNATDPISSYPVRGNCVMLVKAVVDRETDRILSPEDLLGTEYLANLRNTTKFRYLDNSPEEIVEGVVEMLDGLEHGFVDTPPQILFRDRATHAGHNLRLELNYVRKWGTDEGFLGDGRIGRHCIGRLVARGGR